MTIHYIGFMENESVAYDSTFRQGRSPKVFHVGKGEVVPGLELAEKSMCVGEEAQFVISYNLLYGELGCLPRIKPKANILFIITLQDISLTGDETGVERLSESDKTQFPIVMVRDIYIKGSDAFKHEN